MAFLPDPTAYAALKLELTTDPAVRGYAVHIAAGSDHRLADLLNTPRVGAPRRDLTEVPKSLLWACIVHTEYTALAAGAREWVRGVLAGDGAVDLRTGTPIRDGFAALFGAATVTRANFLAATQKDPSRAEELDLVPQGGRVTDADIARALRSTP